MHKTPPRPFPIQSSSSSSSSSMAMRSALTSLPARLGHPAAARRLLSDGKGRVLNEEERAKETVYIQKMERERQEKLKKKLEQEKDKNKPADSDKKPEGSN